MSSHQAKDREPQGEALVDSLVREARARAIRAGSAEVAGRPPDDDLDAYLTGIATADQMLAVQTALAESEALRREVVERAMEIEELRRPEIKRMFDRTRGWPPPGPVGLRDRRAVHPAEGAWFWRFLRAPALAYTLLLAAAVYPTYRWLSAERALKRSETQSAPLPPVKEEPEGKSPEASLVLPSQTLFIRGQNELTLRGIEGVEVPVFTIDAATRIVDVTVWAPASWTPDSKVRYSATILDEHGKTIWKAEDFGGYVNVAGENAFRLSIDRRQLVLGELRIRIDRIDPVALETHVIFARFRLAAAE
jgi:hypothetical protein